MDFSFSEEEERFRKRVRDFLKSNLPAGWGQPGFKLPEGTSNLQLHRDWQRRLYQAGFRRHGVAQRIRRTGSKPDRAGHLNEELARVRAPAMLNLTGVTPGRSDPDCAWNRGAEKSLPRQDSLLRGNLVPALLRAQRRVRPRVAQNAGGVGGRRVRRQRPEDLEYRRPAFGLGHPAGPHRSRRPQASRYQLSAAGHEEPRHHRQTAAPDAGRFGFLRGLFRQRARPARQPGRAT